MLLGTPLAAQETQQIRVDLAAHFFGGYYVCEQLDRSLTLKESIAITMAGGLLVEFIDLKWGDGFDEQDLCADLGGCMLHVLTNYLIFPNKKYNLTITKTKRGTFLTARLNL